MCKNFIVYWLVKFSMSLRCFCFYNLRLCLKLSCTKCGRVHVGQTISLSFCLFLSLPPSLSPSYSGGVRVEEIDGIPDEESNIGTQLYDPNKELHYADLEHFRKQPFNGTTPNAFETSKKCQDEPVWLMVMSGYVHVCVYQQL